ncbi:EboA domain-containing protein [Pedobacter sp. Leaf170]|uniref:EboA domain-containing protein n=1 Tax=Pedobacter sp. Leaf170 TaxID=2876558 RepID=UPI001E4FC44D|nr:EboA domain-containing protein [Pedobacter sp. Leaf170]
MATDNYKEISNLFFDILQDNLNEASFAWLQHAGKASELTKLGQSFVLLPRKTGKLIIKISSNQLKTLEKLELTTIKEWTVDRLARVWLLHSQSYQPAGKAKAVIENLFLSAEVNEAVALYLAIPFLSEPESWINQCTEGIRSNIGVVLEAIMENNPYPSKYLSEAAWNQLVLKAFFTEKNINNIIGLAERANASLALTLSDYARERYAAGRKVNPALWQLTAPFLDEKIFEAMKIGLQKQDTADKMAITEAIKSSDYKPAKRYMEDLAFSESSK